MGISLNNWEFEKLKLEECTERWNTMERCTMVLFDPFAPGDFAEKCVLKLVKWFSGHCHAIKS